MSGTIRDGVMREHLRKTKTDVGRSVRRDEEGVSDEKARSIFEQDKGRWSQAPTSQPQSPAVRGFSPTSVQVHGFLKNRFLAIGKRENARFSGGFTDVRKEKYRMDYENKVKTTLWLHPSIIEKADSVMKLAKCHSRSELMEDALQFYCGYV